MLIVLLVIFLVIFFLFGIFMDDEAIWCIGGAITFLILFISIILIGFVVDGRVIDDKLLMYEEENTKIETSIDSVVSTYMKYESETFTTLKDGDGMEIIMLYPELKSDGLVKLLIETYHANNAKIKELKESKLNISNYKWWLYFGR